MARTPILISIPSLGWEIAHRSEVFMPSLTDKLLRRFELRLPDSESGVLTATLQERLIVDICR